MKKWWIAGGVIIIVLIILFIPNYHQLNLESEFNGGNMKVQTAFNNNESIPAKYTCDGDNVSPPLTITEIPNGTVSLAVICDDPDAPGGTWTHWLLWNIPVNEDSVVIKKGMGVSGTNSGGKLGYSGPCPPSGTHRYFFKVYALDSELDLSEGSSKVELENKMQGHLLDKAEIMGRYSRR